MNYKYILFLGITLLLFPYIVTCNNSVNDSLKLELSKAVNDSFRCSILGMMVENEQNDSIWIIYNDQIYNICNTKLSGNISRTEANSYKKFLALAYNNYGYLANLERDLDKAMSYHEKSLELQKEIKNRKGEAQSYVNMGLVYNSKGLTMKAIEYFHKSLKIQEEINDEKFMSNSLNNIGALYNIQGDIEKAEEYYVKALKLREKLGDKFGQASTLNNIGYIYKMKGELAKGIEYTNKSLQLRKEVGDLRGIGESLGNLGVAYYDLENYTEALSLLEQALELYTKIGDKRGLSRVQRSIGSVYMRQNKLSQALDFANLSFENASQIGFVENIRDASELLYKIYEREKRGLDALKYHKIYIQMKDSISNMAAKKSLLKKEVEYEFEKAQILAEQQRNEELRIQKTELQRRDNLQYSIIFVAILVVFGIVMSLGFIQVSPKVAEGLIFFAFLILFEFLLVLTDPYVDTITNSEPMYKLLANAVLAGAIFPAHAFFENVLKNKLINSSNK